ncbi:MAG: hypothetical protein HQK51_04880 [Oligoflexia bacterium]|nr:hypothetical protein [Oligoflexia bacterium]
MATKNNNVLNFNRESGKKNNSDSTKKIKANGGVEEAAHMLSILPVKERERLLNEIGIKDSALAQKIKAKMITFEDMRFLTTNMLISLMKEISVKLIGIALRASSTELKEYILKNVSSNIRSDISNILNGPAMKLSQVREAQKKIEDLLRSKVDSGEIIINRSGNEKFV